MNSKYHKLVLAAFRHILNMSKGEYRAFLFNIDFYPVEYWDAIRAIMALADD